MLIFSVDWIHAGAQGKAVSGGSDDLFTFDRHLQNHCVFPCLALYSDVPVRGGIEIDVVHSDASPPDHAQFLRMAQKRSIGIHGRAPDLRVGDLEMLPELAVQLVSRNHGVTIPRQSRGL